MSQPPIEAESGTLISPARAVDDGRDSPRPPLLLVSDWLFGASILLLLPRQFVAAFIAFASSLALRRYHRHKYPPPPASPAPPTTRAHAADQTETDTNNLVGAPKDAAS